RHAWRSILGTGKWLRTKNCSVGVVALLSAKNGNSRFSGSRSRTIRPGDGLWLWAWNGRASASNWRAFMDYLGTTVPARKGKSSHGACCSLELLALLVFENMRLGGGT